MPKGGMNAQGNSFYTDAKDENQGRKAGCKHPAL